MRPDQYRLTLDRHSRAVADVSRSVGRMLSTTELTDDDLTDAARVLHPAIVAGRELAHETALRFIAAQAKSQGYSETVPVPAPRPYALEDTQKGLKSVLVDQGTPADVEAAVAKTAVRHTEDAARKAVEDVAAMSTEPDPATGETREPVGWARQLTGAENCPFCVVMASRGATYHTRQTAMGDVARKNKKGIHDGIHRYHNGCDCVAVPVFDRKNWSGNALARYLYSKVYKEAIAKYPEDDAFAAVRKFMINDLGDDELKIPQMRNGELDGPEVPDEVPDFVSADLLSQETKDLIDGTTDRLPDDEAEWERIRKQSGITNRQAQRNQRAEYYEKRAKDDSSRATARKDYDELGAQEYRDQAKKNRAYAKEIRAGKHDAQEVDPILEANGMDPDEGIGYEVDKNGHVLPPQSYLDRVDEVQMVGRSALADLKKAVEMDPELTRLEEDRKNTETELLDLIERQEALELEQMKGVNQSMPEPTASIDEVNAWLDRMSGKGPDRPEEMDRNAARLGELRVARKAAALATERRRGQILKDVVASRRALASPGDMKPVAGKRWKEEYGWTDPATDADLDKIRNAATFFPSEWVKKMEAERGALYVTTGVRGYYRASNPFSHYPGDQINLSDQGEWNRGSVTDGATKTAMHEIGHRMEKTFPAIPRLEWAYLYRRATKNDKREPVKTIPYGPKTEKAFHDEFTNKYTGKTYQSDPDSAPWREKGWEVFTTGLEALYGNDTRFQDADEDLQSFIMGILLTVGV